MNRDGVVTQQELQQFLDQKSGKGQFDPEVVGDLFRMIDVNGDGHVTLDEFVSKYLETRQKLLERQTEMC